MRLDLWLQPTGSNPLLRQLKRLRLEAHSVRQTARIALETGGELPSTAKSKLPGDQLALRGLPVVGRDLGDGAIAGTSPERALLEKERQATRAQLP
jgi:hypothetical protein